MTTGFTHLVYNSEGRCLTGLILAESATPEQVVAAYLVQTGGTLAVPVLVDRDGSTAWFNEKHKGRERARYAVRRFHQPWA